MEGEDTPVRSRDTTPSLESPIESVAEETGQSGLSFGIDSDEITESGWSSNVDTSSIDSSFTDSSSHSSKSVKMTTVKIGGVDITLANTARTQTNDETPMFKKGLRAALSEDKRNDLFEKATKNVITSLIY